MADLTQVGGKFIQRGQVAPGAQNAAADDYWDFGWLNPEVRQEHHWQALQNAENEFANYHLQGKADPSIKKVDLTELWQHAAVVAALKNLGLGFNNGFPGAWQLTGSCVGAGGDNTIFTMASIEVLEKNDPEQIFLPWWLFTYGRSRFLMGDRGQGEGSLESMWAKAAGGDGVINVADHPSLPKPKKITELGYCYTSALELTYSDGDCSENLALLEVGRKHPIKTVAIMRNADDVRSAIVDAKCPVGEGSMYGYMSWIGDDGTSLGKRGPRWGHKMTIMGWMEHPKYGERFKIVNQWDSASTDSGRFNHVWVPREDIDWICRDECRAYSNLDGFVARTLDFFV